jgi:hypothetical protein
MLLQTLEKADDVFEVHSHRRFFIDEDFELNMELLSVLCGRPKANTVFRIMREK